MTTILFARSGSWSSDAKKKARARVLRSPALKVFRNDGAPGPGLPAPMATGWLLITTLYVQEEPARALTGATPAMRSEEHTSELQSLMRISYAVFCLKKKNTITTIKIHTETSDTAHTTLLYIVTKQQTN